MALHIRAIYQNGSLKPLEPLDLQDGQQVEITIEERNYADALREALGDMAIWPDPTDDRHPETEALADEIAQAFSGGKSISEIIIEERGER